MTDESFPGEEKAPVGRNPGGRSRYLPTTPIAAVTIAVNVIYLVPGLLPAKYLTPGILFLLVFQIFQNAGMTMGIMPITGIPLPLVSYGGSSTIALFAGLGLVQGVHMRRFT